MLNVLSAGMAGAFGGTLAMSIWAASGFITSLELARDNFPSLGIGIERSECNLLKFHCKAGNVHLPPMNDVTSYCVPLGSTIVLSLVPRRLESRLPLNAEGNESGLLNSLPALITEGRTREKEYLLSVLSSMMLVTVSEGGLGKLLREKSLRND